MPSVSAHKLGLALGGLFGFIHLLWSIAVAIGIGQWYIDTIFGLHMIKAGITVTAFSWTSAIILIIVTSVVGYLVGLVAGALWNMVHKS